MSNWSARAKAHFSSVSVEPATETGEIGVLGVLGGHLQGPHKSAYRLSVVLGAPAGVPREKPHVIDPLSWLRSFLGSDTVPLTSIKDAARKDGVPWFDIQMLAPDYVIDQISLDKVYWKLARMNVRHRWFPMEGSNNGQE